MAVQDLDSPADPCRVSSSLADQVCGAVVCAGTSLLRSDEGRTVDLATISAVLCAGAGCAGFLRRASSASSCIDFQTVYSWKVVLSLVHPGSAMPPLGTNISSLVSDTEAVRIRASEAGVLVLRQA